MKKNLFLLLGIPLIFIIGIMAWETEKLYWLFLYVPIAALGIWRKREMSAETIIVLPKRKSPEIVDTTYTSGK